MLDSPCWKRQWLSKANGKTQDKWIAGGSDEGAAMAGGRLSMCRQKWHFCCLQIVILASSDQPLQHIRERFNAKVKQQGWESSVVLSQGREGSSYQVRGKSLPLVKDVKRHWILQNKIVILSVILVGKLPFPNFVLYESHRHMYRLEQDLGSATI